MHCAPRVSGRAAPAPAPEVAHACPPFTDKTKFVELVAAEGVPLPTAAAASKVVFARLWLTPPGGDSDTSRVGEGSSVVSVNVRVNAARQAVFRSHHVLEGGEDAVVRVELWGQSDALVGSSSCLPTLLCSGAVPLAALRPAPGDGDVAVAVETGAW